MKEIHHNANYTKNNHYRFKVEPLESKQYDYIDEADIKNFDISDDCHYLLKFKIDKKFYIFYIKTDASLNDHVVVDIDDDVMTVMQMGSPEDSLNQSNETINGFAHSFAIPKYIKMDEIKLYSKGQILLIVIPRLLV